ncbi:MAG: hypothetical protein ING69_10780 [Rhodocyclaceae bacterium]|nr:hypothetical protein [Rhodocyclaceae bacterium]
MSQLLLRRPPSISDTQRLAVRDFLRAFPSDTYRIQTVKRTAAARTKNVPAASPADLLRLVDTGTLAHANVSGCCIFARPVRRDLILIDDLPPHSAAALAGLGLAPCAIIQSSPLKTNVVIRFPGIPHDNAPLHRLVQAHVVDTLIDLGLSADPAAARDLQVWRLPGFSNQKRLEDGSLKYSNAAGYGFMTKFLAIEPDAVASRAAEFVARAQAEIECADTAGLSPRLQKMAAEDVGGDIEVKTLTISSPEKYFKAIYQRVADAEEGKRNYTLYAQAYSIARFVHGTAKDVEYQKLIRLVADDVQMNLFEAAEAAGLKGREIDSTITSAFNRAKNCPIFIDVPGLN